MTNALHKSLFRDIHSSRITPDDEKNKNGSVGKGGNRSHFRPRENTGSFHQLRNKNLIYRLTLC